MRTLILALSASILAACGNSADLPGAFLSVTGARGAVVAYKEHWKQGYHVARNGEVKVFDVSGNPRTVETTPDESQVLLLDIAGGRLTAVDAITARARYFKVRPDRDAMEFSRDSRYVLFHATGSTSSHGLFDPNAMTLVDLNDGKVADFSVGSYPSAVAFFYKQPGSAPPTGPRLLLFSAAKMTQIDIDLLFKGEAATAYAKTRDLATNNDVSRIPLNLVQTDRNLYLTLSGIKEFLSVSLVGDDDPAPINFEINDVQSPQWMALSPMMDVTTETVFPHGRGRKFQLLYVLNNNKTITVFDAADLSNSRIVDARGIEETPQRILATADGKRVLFYAAVPGAGYLYRLNVRTGAISKIPFDQKVKEFLVAGDGSGVVALHDPAKGETRPSFTYVDFIGLFKPILLPGPVAQAVLTSDGGQVVFRFGNGEPLRKFNLHRGLMDEVNLSPVRVGATGSDGEIWSWMDAPGGRLVFSDLESGTSKTVENFIFNGILDR